MINEVYYTSVVKHEAKELRDRAASDRLAREAKELRRSQRAHRREVERLEHAVHGQPGRWARLLARLGIGRSGRGSASPAQRTATAGREAERTGTTSDKA